MNTIILEEIKPVIRGIFADITRYPTEILEFDARLEEDLGIDSVKLGEVFSVLRERFHLPKEINIPPEKLRNIAGISEALHGYLSTIGTSDNKGPAADEVPVALAARVGTNGTHGISGANGANGAV